MTLTFYLNSSDPKVVTKTLTQVASFDSAAMRDVLDVVNPTFRVATSALPQSFNYAYCDTTGRYYFCEQPVMVRTGLYDIKCKSDVLMTAAAQLKTRTATVSRNEFRSNGYLLDPYYKTYAYKECVTKKFPNSMDDDSIILITVG